jgi:four helix bundle protein
MTDVEFSKQLVIRTKKFALRAIRLFQHMPKTDEAKILGKQLLRSSTSVAANYRAACRGRSNNEWYSKLCIVVEEADETQFWTELLIDSEIFKEERIRDSYNESTELLALFTTIKKSSKPVAKN